MEKVMQEDQKIPLFLSGIIVDVGFGFCMDGVEHQLIHISPKGDHEITRIGSNLEDVKLELGKVSGSKQKLMVAGYLKKSIEAGCLYLGAYYAGPEIQPDEFAKLIKR